MGDGNGAADGGRFGSEKTSSSLLRLEREPRCGVLTPTSRGDTDDRWFLPRQDGVNGSTASKNAQPPEETLRPVLHRVDDEPAERRLRSELVEAREMSSPSRGDQASPLAEGGRNGHVEALADAIDERGLLAPVTRRNDGGRRDRQEEREHHGWIGAALLVFVGVINKGQ